MTDPIVYVVQATRHQPDVTPASVYGKVRFLLTVGDRTSCDPDRVLKKLELGLKEFRSEKDYILWSGGDPLSLFLTSTVLAELDHDRFNYLRYERADARSGRTGSYYVPVSVPLFLNT